MRMKYVAMLLFASFFCFATCCQAAASIIEQLSFDTNVVLTVRPVKIRATLYLPPVWAPIAAMVIVSSSGGVLDWIEGYYARELARNGIAGWLIASDRAGCIM